MLEQKKKETNVPPKMGGVPEGCHPGVTPADPWGTLVFPSGKLPLRKTHVNISNDVQ
jgi:hypothetical protein